MTDSTVLITLAGHAPTHELLRWRADQADLSIAVDGGWLAHRYAGVEPDVILGDFDSCGDLSLIKKIFPRSSMHELKDQSFTDFEKALEWIEVRGLPDKIVVLGGLGKRMDHTISNLMIAGRVDPSVEIVFDDVHEFASRITPMVKLSLLGHAGGSVSILPMGECQGIQSKGLEWELENKNFSWDKMISQSNRCISDEVCVTSKSGVLYGFISKEA